MSFVYPAGLWALLGLAVLIAVCMARRHAEVTPVSSTYLWRLSDQHRRKNRHLRRLKRALYFLLHALEIVLAALLIAQPMITMPGSGVNVAVILDGSASMRMADAEGETRFARAVAAAERDMARLPWGASVTVLLAGDEAVVAADHVSPGAELRAALEGAACGWGEGDLDGALALCDAMLDEGKISRVCLYTDTQYEQTEGIEVFCLEEAEEWNVSLGKLRAEGSIYGTAFETEIISSGRSADIAFELTVDGKVQDGSAIVLRVNGREETTGIAYCPEGEETTVSLLLRQVYDYSDVRLTARVEDGLQEDNETHLIEWKETTARVLLVGEHAYFWEKALSALPQAELTTAENLKEAVLEGYDIYAFDGCLPEKLPDDGAVWLLNPPRSPRAVGVVFGERLMGAYLTRANAGNALEKQLTQNLALRDAAVARFYEMTSQGQLENVLMCGEMTALAAGRDENGCLRLVMPFDLQESSLPLLPDFVVLVHNMTEASAPALLQNKIVSSGEMVSLHPHPLCSKLFLQTPDLHVHTLNPDEGEIRIAVPGSYTLLQEVRGEQRVLQFFAEVPKEERMTKPAVQTKPLVLSADGDVQQSQTADARIFYPAHLLAILLMALLLAEWGMYHHERY